MDDCIIGENSIIAAGAVLSARTIVELVCLRRSSCKEIKDADPID